MPTESDRNGPSESFAWHSKRSEESRFPDIETLRFSQGDANAEKPVIQLESISVLYRVPRERLSGIKEYTVRWLQRRVQYEEFWALQDVSFQVARGESFGVIGRNGSGKSTLLKVMARVLYPARGRIVTRGKVAPMLELGGGFHPELTGRENVYLNAALLGYPRNQVDELFPAIVDFAEIGDFIDAPIRTYSTGMVARLGFAVATCIRPDILLLDEVLSVGDGRFQQKCLDRMFSFRDQGTTIIFVSHSMSTVEAFCQRALWLDGGRGMAVGAVEDVIRHYVQAERSEHRPGSAPETPLPPQSAKVPEPVFLSEVGRIYPSSGILNVEHGAVSVWLKFHSDQPHRDAIIFHSDDSRYALYVGAYYSSEYQCDIWQVIARAGGNRRAFDTFFGTAGFPETMLVVDHDGNVEPGELPHDEWRLVTMTWRGYPEGRLRLYLDDRLVIEKMYSRQNDDGRSLPRLVAVGMRPTDWMGEIVSEESSQARDSRPESTLPVVGSGLEICDLRLYPEALTPDQVSTVYQAGMPAVPVS